MNPSSANARRDLAASTAAVGGGGALGSVVGWFGDRAEYAQEEVLGGAMRDLSGAAGDGVRTYAEGGADAGRRIGTGAAIALAIAVVTVPVVVGGVAIYAIKRSSDDRKPAGRGWI